MRTEKMNAPFEQYQPVGFFNPASYLKRVPATALALLKLFEVVLAAVTILLSASIMLPVITKVLSFGGQAETLDAMIRQVLAALEPQIPGIEDLIGSSPLYTTIVSSIPAGTHVAVSGLYILLYILWIFLLLKIIESLACVYIRFIHKGAGVVRFFYLVSFVYRIFCAVATVVLCVLILASFGSIRPNLPEGMQGFTAVFLIIMSCVIMVAASLLAMFYSKDIASAMKTVKLECRYRTMAAFRPSRLFLICMIYVVFRAVAVILSLVVGSSVSGAAGSMMMVSSVVVLFKYLMVGFSYRDMKKAHGY